MTETRKYFEKLVTIFDSLCKVKQNEIVKFVQIKNELFAVLTEIKNYRLLEFDLPQKCLEIISSEDCQYLSEEQSLLAVHLADQLCSQLSGKLWYGGELLYHLNRLTISAYHLPVQIQREINLIDGEDNLGIQLRIRLSDSENSEKAIQILITKNLELIESTNGKFRKIESEHYSNLLSQLKEKVSFYRSYVNHHYPSLADHFSYSRKLIKAYLCDERKDVIVCRIQSYSNLADLSINLNEHIIDFCPRPPYNFEKIDSPLSSWSWFGIEKSTWKIPSNIFSTESIHRELLNIFLTHASESDLVDFVSFLIRTTNLKVELNKNDHTFLKINGATTKEYLKVFHKDNITEDYLKLTIQELKSCESGYSHQVLFSSKPDDIILDFLKKNQVTVRHLSELSHIHFDNHNSELIHLYIKSKLESMKFGLPTEMQEGQILIQELKNCQLGKTGWPNYEKIGAEIFKFLFADSFTQYISETQASNEEDNLRRDLIVHNNYESNSSFWSRVNNDFKAKLIIVEFKNYTDELGYETIHSTTKYLSGKTGNFILIFSRKGGKNSLLKQQKELLGEGKLIICFDDKELTEMIEEKISGRNPLYRIELKYFSLLKK